MGGLGVRGAVKERDAVPGRHGRVLARRGADHERRRVRRAQGEPQGPGVDRRVFDRAALLPRHGHLLGRVLRGNQPVGQGTLRVIRRRDGAGRLKLAFRTGHVHARPLPRHRALPARHLGPHAALDRRHLRAHLREPGPQPADHAPHRVAPDRVGRAVPHGAGPLQGPVHRPGAVPRLRRQQPPLLRRHPRRRGVPDRGRRPVLQLQDGAQSEPRHAAGELQKGAFLGGVVVNSLFRVGIRI